MRRLIVALSFVAHFSCSSSVVRLESFPETNQVLVPAMSSGNTNCSAAVSPIMNQTIVEDRVPQVFQQPPEAPPLEEYHRHRESADAENEKSLNTTFQLTFISYGNWTALPSQDENPIQHLESISFAVSNMANGVSTVCAFPLGVTLSGDSREQEDVALSAHPFPHPGALLWTVAATTSGNKVISKGASNSNSDMAATWQACADRKDTDGKHRFTIATGAAFGLAERSLVVNQTWFCHDDVERLVAFTGVASTLLNLTCSESEASGYHLRNCTSLDLQLPVTLL
ncbi:hypothetical protein NUW58_g1357 [Xylaria curta]|uniref:Uncharacterized protein n=1 Tax=Xylaria curta TaxID=42375 RepID=A0ACC1PNH4_9PEZI|nr:hypothetical protein NUW58_g1357 [Xylaria curta]